LSHGVTATNRPVGAVPVNVGVENAVPFHCLSVSVPFEMNSSSAVGPPNRAK
jgi:hypothetical protein